MSRVGIQNDLANVLAYQVTTAFTPIVTGDDAARVNRIVATAWLNAGAAVLDGYSAAMKTLVASIEARAPESPQKIIVE